VVEGQKRAAPAAGLAVLVAVAVLAVGGSWWSAVGSDTGTFTGGWTGPDGRPAARGESREFTYEVSAFEGPDHCEWQSAVFLNVGWPLGTTQGVTVGPSDSRSYIRDAEGALPFTEGLDLDTELPPGATPTGYRTGDVELWFGDDGGDRWAYLVRGDGTVERWPRDVENVACG
jgi:hypothetical protein